MKSAWPIIWTVVGVVVSCEVGFLAWSGRLPALLSSATGIAAQVRAEVEHPGQQDLPVHVVTPPSRGASYPLLQNASAHPMKLRVSVRRPGTNQQQEWLIELEPNQTLPLDRRGGWNFASGDELALVQDGYRTRKVQLP